MYSFCVSLENLLCSLPSPTLPALKARFSSHSYQLHHTTMRSFTFPISLKLEWLTKTWTKLRDFNRLLMPTRKTHSLHLNLFSAKLFCLQWLYHPELEEFGSRWWRHSVKHWERLCKYLIRDPRERVAWLPKQSQLTMETPLVQSFSLSTEPCSSLVFIRAKGWGRVPSPFFCITSMWLAQAGAARLTVLHWPEHGQPPTARTSQYFVPMPTGSIQALGKVTPPVKTIHSLSTYNFNF